MFPTHISLFILKHFFICLILDLFSFSILQGQSGLAVIHFQQAGFFQVVLKAGVATCPGICLLMAPPLTILVTCLPSAWQVSSLLGRWWIILFLLAESFSGLQIIIEVFYNAQESTICIDLHAIHHPGNWFQDQGHELTYWAGTTNIATNDWS